MEKEEKVKVIKTAARKYRVISTREDGSEERRQTAPAEYAVVRGDERLALIVKAGDGWRVCEPSESSRLGLAVSPIGLDTFGMVRRWALQEYA